MQKSFNDAVDQIVDRDSRYEKEAYIFLKDALEFTIKQQKRAQNDPNSHVSAAELLDGFRQLALKEFGPMTMTVLEYWRVISSEDIGNMVFALIEAGVFGKTDSDAPEDFHHALNFHSAFAAPFEKLSTDRTTKA